MGITMKETRQVVKSGIDGWKGLPCRYCANCKRIEDDDIFVCVKNAAGMEPLKKTEPEREGCKSFRFGAL